MSGSLAEQSAFALAVAASGSVGVLCFDDDAPAFAPLPTITYGRQDDAEAQAQLLFSALHQVDALGVAQILTQVTSETSGVFLAVRNRLLKAAGFNQVNLPDQ
jgi:L-threonylcarbamoyladenylate synthase